MSYFEIKRRKNLSGLIQPLILYRVSTYNQFIMDNLKNALSKAIFNLRNQTGQVVYIPDVRSTTGITIQPPGTKGSQILDNQQTDVSFLNNAPQTFDQGAGLAFQIGTGQKFYFYTLFVNNTCNVGLSTTDFLDAQNNANSNMKTMQVDAGANLVRAEWKSNAGYITFASLK